MHYKQPHIHSHLVSFYQEPTSAKKTAIVNKKEIRAHKKPTQKKQETTQEPPKRKGSTSVNTAPSRVDTYDDPKDKHKQEKQRVVAVDFTRKSVPLFSHLPQYQRIKHGVLERIVKPTLAIHPAIYELGLQYASYQITGANRRCLAMVQALRQYIVDYQGEHEKSMALDLFTKINPLIEYLNNCRQKSVGMGNFIRYFFKPAIEMTHSMTLQEGKEYLLKELDDFIELKILKADEEIANFGVDKISDGDVILTYARSMVVTMTLKRAHSLGKQFKVVVVDSRPRFEGKAMLKDLVDAGIECEYIMINAVSYMIKEATKVFIGAHSIMSNGQVYSRVGTSLVCMMAKSYHVPVLVLCEAYKFSVRVQIDAICQNELDDPEELNTPVPTGESKLEGWQDIKHLRLLNLAYDLTPTEFVTMVITEMGMVPPTSAPVVVRHIIGIFQ